MNIYWSRCKTYNEAKDYYHVVYLHEWNGKPFYWGKAHNSFFGGHSRSTEELTASGRYGPSYKHWIEGCLKNGGRLYIGKVDKVGVYFIDDIERFLIATYPSEMNKKSNIVSNTTGITHSGDVPASVLRN